MDQKTYYGIAPDSKDVRKKDGYSAPNTDTVIISRKARQTAMTAQMEKAGIDQGTAKKLISGKFNITEPDWETFEAPVLQGQADRKIYDTAYFEAYTKELGALADRVQAYYEPEFSKIKGMNIEAARAYLFKTYK